MSNLAIEVTGDSSAAVDEATSAMFAELSGSGVKIRPSQTSGERDGGIIALAFAILGGAASIAQVASTVHTMARRKDVQIIVIDSSGNRTQIAASLSTEEVRALVEKATSDS